MTTITRWNKLQKESRPASAGTCDLKYGKEDERLTMGPTEVDYGTNRLEPAATGRNTFNPLKS